MKAHTATCGTATCAKLVTTDSLVDVTCYLRMRNHMSIVGLTSEELTKVEDGLAERNPCRYTMWHASQLFVLGYVFVHACYALRVT